MNWKSALLSLTYLAALAGCGAGPEKSEIKEGANAPAARAITWKNKVNFEKEVAPGARIPTLHYEAVLPDGQLAPLAFKKEGTCGSQLLIAASKSHVTIQGQAPTSFDKACTVTITAAAKTSLESSASYKLIPSVCANGKAPVDGQCSAKTCTDSAGVVHALNERWADRPVAINGILMVVCRESGIENAEVLCESGFPDPDLQNPRCYPLKPVETKCKEDETLIAGRCVKLCGIDGRCTNPPRDPDFPNCGLKSHWDGTRCVPNAPVNPTCQFGYHWDGTRCVKDTIQNPHCPQGSHWNGRTCVLDGFSSWEAPVNPRPIPGWVDPLPPDFNRKDFGLSSSSHRL